MKTSPLPLLLSFLAIASFLRADDATVVSQLESMGGKITMHGPSASQVTFTDCSKLGDAEFQAIGQLSHLKGLTLYGKCHGLNDLTIQHLAGLKELETLGTDGAQLSDEGLKHLAALKSLKNAAFFHLSFGMKGFTGAGFVHLKACPSLEKLTVAGMSMGDEGFAAIATLTHLRELRTWHTYQTEAGNAHIAKLSQLTSLQLGQRLPRANAKPASLSDASLPMLASIKTLESLKIGEAHFTIDALTALKTLPQLKSLNLYETDLTATDVEQLRAALPGVKIDWQPLTDEQRKKFDMYLKP